MGQLDFTLYQNKEVTRVFIFKNSDGTVYDLSSSTIKLYIYITETPIEILCNIDSLTGKVYVPFTTSITQTLGFFEYIIVETKNQNETEDLIRGNISIIIYTPFTDTIESFLQSELPNNLSLTEDFKNQKIIYWKRFLQEAFNILEPDIYGELALTSLQKALIAKLIVCDALMLCTRGSYIQFAGGDYTQTNSTESMGGPIKKIETGPSNVEFHSMADAISKLFQSNAQGYSPWDKLCSDVCGLASKLRVKIPLCKDTSWVNTYVPGYSQNPNWLYPSLDDIDSIAGQGSFEDLNITLP